MTFGVRKRIPTAITKIQNFPNLGWRRRTAAILKRVFWPKLGIKLSAFGQILCELQNHVLTTFP